MLSSAYDSIKDRPLLWLGALVALAIAVIVVASRLGYLAWSAPDKFSAVAPQCALLPSPDAVSQLNALRLGGGPPRPAPDDFDADAMGTVASYM